MLVQKLDANGTQVWLTPIASAFNERAYGVVDGQDGAVIVAGFMRQGHDAGENDDGLVVKIDADGTELWRTTIGTDEAADRIYGVASDGAGGAFVTGYTSGVLAGERTNAGDKDAILARIDTAGAVLWATQFGSTGEDKGFAVSAAADGGVYVGGSAATPYRDNQVLAAMTAGLQNSTAPARQFGPNNLAPWRMTRFPVWSLPSPV